MRRNCSFQVNPAFFAGVILLCARLFMTNVLEPEGAAGLAARFLSGASCGLLFVGLLYGSAKTRPLFDKFRAFKLRLAGRK